MGNLCDTHQIPVEIVPEMPLLATLQKFQRACPKSLSILWRSKTFGRNDIPFSQKVTRKNYEFLYLHYRFWIPVGGISFWRGAPGETGQLVSCSVRCTEFYAMSGAIMLLQMAMACGNYITKNAVG